MPPQRPDEQARREYWTSAMEEACAFFAAAAEIPVAECGEPLVPLADAVAQAGAEVTFSAQPHAQGRPRLFYLRRGLIESFLEAARAMNARGWALHVEDAFRTPDMQRGLWLAPSIFGAILRRVRWELGGRRPPEELVFRRAAALIAARPKVGTHLSGSAVDVSVFRRQGRTELDRGGPYPEMSERTPMDSPFVDPEARANRRAITEVFRRFGFLAYPWEFWHYSQGDVFEARLRGLPGPVRYGPVDFDPAGGEVRPIADPTRAFFSLEDIRRMIAAYPEED